ncbi:hypothetical protein AB0A66_32795 [Streptomyces longwoodensis]|uniref:hypothetical protein n=1 Tax=Streptomyces longwoodensis TaxID=68231 RepID=UPI003411C524
MFAVTTATVMLLSGSNIAAANSDNEKHNWEYSPASRPAAGPEKLTLANDHRPESGNNLKAAPGTKDANGVWQVNRTNPTLSNTVTDGDGDTANLTYQVYTTDASGNPKDQVKLTDPDTGKPAAYGVVVSNFVTSGGTAKVTLHYGDLKPNTTYAFRTSAYDGSLYETDWSAWAKFKTRGRAVDIKIPEPNKSAPAVDLDRYQEPLVGTRNRPGVTATAKAAGKGNETCTDHGQKITCISVGKPSDLSAKQKQDIADKLRTGSGSLVPWCTDTGVSVGKDYLKRDSACLKWATPIVYTYKFKAPDGTVYNPADAHFASAIEIKLDPVSRKFTQRFALVPMDPFIVEHGTIGMPGPITMTPTFKCSPECTTAAPVWDGSNTWLPKGDLHAAYATFNHEWTGGTATKITSLQLDWTIAGTVNDGAGEIENDPQWLGNSIPDFDIRCDVVASATSPGCVFAAYKPTWVMNFAKTPAAVAHAWLIQSKLPNHPGSKTAGKPIKYLPASVRDSDLNRKVICPDGWAKTYGSPDTTPIDTSDTASCDEFAYAASYNSAGMPASLQGMNEVDTGNDCVQTYATRIATGDWRLYDDIRTAAPTWKEVCGRSSMSNYQNTQSMQPFSGTFSSASKYRLLDKDEYWVAFPEFAHCDASKATVSCTVPKP